MISLFIYHLICYLTAFDLKCTVMPHKPRSHSLLFLIRTMFILPCVCVGGGGVCVCVCWSFSPVRLFLTLWTVACQAPLSMEFFSKKTWENSYSLLKRTFPTWGLNPSLQHFRQTLYHLSCQGSSYFSILTVLS